MPLIDAKLLLSDAQAFTSVGTTASTNILDFGVADPNIGAGTPLWLHCTVNTAVTSAGTPTVSATVMHSATGTGSWLTLTQGPAILKGSLTAGDDVINQPLPATLKRYLKLKYTVATATLTAGKFDAWIDWSSNKDLF